eukprot:7331818-Pyramimonas_sp.AAC.3
MNYDTDLEAVALVRDVRNNEEDEVEMFDMENREDGTYLLSLRITTAGEYSVEVTNPKSP